MNNESKADLNNLQIQIEQNLAEKLNDEREWGNLYENIKSGEVKKLLPDKVFIKWPKQEDVSLEFLKIFSPLFDSFLQKESPYLWINIVIWDEILEDYFYYVFYNKELFKEEEEKQLKYVHGWASEKEYAKLLAHMTYMLFKEARKKCPLLITTQRKETFKRYKLEPVAIYIDKLEKILKSDNQYWHNSLEKIKKASDYSSLRTVIQGFLPKVKYTDIFSEKIEEIESKLQLKEPVNKEKFLRYLTWVRLCNPNWKFYYYFPAILLADMPVGGIIIVTTKLLSSEEYIFVQNLSNRVFGQVALVYERIKAEKETRERERERTERLLLESKSRLISIWSHDARTIATSIVFKSGQSPYYRKRPTESDIEAIGRLANYLFKASETFVKMEELQSGERLARSLKEPPSGSTPLTELLFDSLEIILMNLERTGYVDKIKWENQYEAFQEIDRLNANYKNIERIKDLCKKYLNIIMDIEAPPPEKNKVFLYRDAKNTILLEAALREIISNAFKNQKTVLDGKSFIAIKIEEPGNENIFSLEVINTCDPNIKVEALDNAIKTPSNVGLAFIKSLQKKISNLDFLNLQFTLTLIDEYEIHGEKKKYPFARACLLLTKGKYYELV